MSPAPSAAAPARSHAVGRSCPAGRSFTGVVPFLFSRGVPVGWLGARSGTLAFAHVRF